MTAILECHQLRHTFGRGATAEEVLRGVDIAFEPGQACVLLGPSGSGKTTLLSILGCLLTPTSGRVALRGQALNGAHAMLEKIRRDELGFVFQHAQLLPFLSVKENLRIVGRNVGMKRAALEARIAELEKRLGLEGMLTKSPDQLSGGQRQRVAIARAVLHRPPIVLADEPTAALDWTNGQAAVRLLIEQARQDGSLLITVTHDLRLVPLFDRVLSMADGRLTEERAA